jgi:hypothetical protein
MATTSQKMMLDGCDVQDENTAEAARRVLPYLIRFLVLIRGVRTPPPRIEDPVKKMPLQETMNVSRRAHVECKCPSTNDVPTSSEDTQTDTKTDSERAPEERTRFFEKATDIECFA